MNQTGNDNNQSNSSMPKVAPPIVKPPVVAPPIMKTPVVAPPVVKTPVIQPAKVIEEDTKNIENVMDEALPTKTINQIENDANVDNTLETPVKTFEENLPEIDEIIGVPIKENTAPTPDLGVSVNNDKAVESLPNEEKETGELEDEYAKQQNRGILDAVNGKFAQKEENVKKKNDMLSDEEILARYMKKLKRRKVIKISILTLFIIIAVILLIKFWPVKKETPISKDGTYVTGIYNKDNYIAIKSSDGYGYMNSKGSATIKNQYRHAEDFIGNYALVAENSEEPKYSIIDRGGNVKLSSGFMPYYHTKYGVWEINNKLYNDNLELLVKDGYAVNYIASGYFYYQSYMIEDFGIMDYKGNEVFEFTIVQDNLIISENEYNEKDIYLVMIDEKDDINLISMSDFKTIFSKPNKDFEITHVSNNVFKIFDKKENNYTWMYLKNGKVVYENDAIKSLEVYDYEKSILIIEDDNGKQYLNLKTKETFDEISKTEKFKRNKFGYDLVTIGKSMGLEKNGKTILETKYKDISFLNELLFNYIKADRDKEFVLAMDYDNTYLIDVKSNKTIATFDSINYILFDETTTIRFDILDESGDLSHYLLYNLMTGQRLEVSLDSEILYGTNYIAISDAKKIRYYDNEFEKIYETRR